MQMFNLFYRKYKLLIVLLLLFFGFITIFKTLSNDKFYGFEYEDSFINSHVASSNQLIKYITKFRTNGCSEFINGECVKWSSYTGHYVTYSLFLYSIDKIFFIDDPFFIHKLGNSILILLTFLFLIYYYKGYRLLICIFFALVVCLPSLYVFNSSLIENLSFSLGVVLVFSLFKFKTTTNQKWLLFYFFIMCLLIMTKRENLIYLFTLSILNPKKLIAEYSFWIFMIIIFITQFLINPFYTEGLESKYLGRDTFSFDYFIYQFPVYIKSFFKIDGYLFFMISILLIKKPTKNSLFFLVFWFCFILLYSFHYRGQYSIESAEITHFETFRYMFNTLPFLFGYYLFGENRIFFLKSNFFFLCFFFMWVWLQDINKAMLLEFGKDEYLNYHKINENIDVLSSENNSKIALHDTFVLISMLNNTSKNVDVFSINNKQLNFQNDKLNYLIDRFNIVKLDEYKPFFSFELIHNMSNESVKLYRINKSIK